MANQPFLSWPFAATDAPTARTMPDRLSDVVNAKDWGATGDGLTDDTNALQAAINYCYGVGAGAHGINYWLNKALFIPNGLYRVSPRATTTISGLANAAGILRLTVASTAGFTTGMVVNMFGIGGATAYNKSSFGIIVDDATHIRLIACDGSQAGLYTGGGTVVGPCLMLRNMQGAYIFGQSRLGTQISSSAPGSCPVSTNGFGYSRVERISFAGSALDGGTGFCYNWDGTGLSSQSNTFQECFFSGDIGLDIGSGQYMCSETMLINNYIGATSVGILNRNYNALQQTIIGGNIAGCAVGIKVVSGSIPIIQGVGFQNFNGGLDIHIVNTVGDGYVISGCRSESDNFIMPQPACAVTLIGTDHLSEVDGYFIQGSGAYMTLINNYSQNGKISGGSELTLINNGNNHWGRADWNQWYGAAQPVGTPPSTSVTTGRAITAGETGTVFDNTGASGSVQLSLPYDITGGGARIPVGTVISGYVSAAQTLRFQCTSAATIRNGSSISAANGFISSNAIGNSVALRCVSAGGAAWAVQSIVGTWTLT